MIKLYFHPSPNPMKIALLLEEAGLPYEIVPVDTRKGEQFAPAFLAINPNGKTPAITDDGHAVFDSTAILLYLAEKSGKFLGAAEDRGQLLSWLMFIATGIGPYSGQAVHFKHFAPEPKTYAVNRYTFEAERHFGILDKHLGEREFLAGDQYTIVDIAFWGWGRVVPFVLGAEAWTSFPNLKRLFDAISARPAAITAAALREKYTFKAEMDDAARAILFPQNARLAAD
jgi:GST-like protein